MPQPTLRERLFPLTTPLIQRWWRMVRGLTLGVRVLATDEQGRVALIRHTYAPGWYLPGGGVERGEAAELAACREFEEETGAAIPRALELVGIFTNFESFPGDHVLLFRAQNVVPVERSPDAEIAEVVWCAPDELPDGVTPATKRRVREMRDGSPPAETW